MQDSDRPHFYSQYWIDIAAGRPTRRAAEAPVAEPLQSETDVDALDDLDLADPWPERPAPAPKPKKAAEPKKTEPVRPTLNSLADLANIDLLMRNSAELAEDAIPDLAADSAAPFAGTAVPEDAAAFAEATEEPAAAEGAEDFEFVADEEEEEDEWGNSRKPKQSKPQKPRRERRTF